MSIELIQSLASLNRLPLNEGFTLNNQDTLKDRAETLKLLREEIFQKNLILNNFISELDATEQAAIYQDWRYRLLNILNDLKASQTRLDWLQHTLTNEHQLSGLIEIIFEFNTKQLDDDQQTFDLIDMSQNALGLFLRIKKIDFDKIL